MPIEEFPLKLRCLLLSRCFVSLPCLELQLSKWWNAFLVNHRSEECPLVFLLPISSVVKVFCSVTFVHGTLCQSYRRRLVTAAGFSSSSLQTWCCICQWNWISNSYKEDLLKQRQPWIPVAGSEFLYSGIWTIRRYVHLQPSGSQRKASNTPCSQACRRVQ